MHTIFLTGPRASGKTTTGLLLAQTLGVEFFDTDAYLIETTGENVETIVGREGWLGFRMREAKALRDVTLPGVVVATGGGIVLAEENRRFMREHGLVIYLSTPLPLLIERLGAASAGSGRPSLTGRGIAEEMAEVLDQRDPLYHEAAHCVVDASGERNEIIQSILNFLRSSQVKGLEKISAQ